MPLSHRHHDARVLAPCFYEIPVYHLSLVIIIGPDGLAAEHGHTLRGAKMPMDGQHRARLQGIEHTLGMVVGRIAQVVVLPQARAGLGLGGEGVEEGLSEKRGWLDLVDNWTNGQLDYLDSETSGLWDN